jgi:hypothetical protein
MVVLTRFSEGLAKFMQDGKWGYVGKNGQVAITLKFDYATDFSMPDKTAKLSF